MHLAIPHSEGNARIFSVQERIKQQTELEKILAKKAAKLC